MQLWGTVPDNDPRFFCGGSLISKKVTIPHHHVPVIFHFLVTSKKVSEPVSKNFVPEKISELVSKLFGTDKKVGTGPYLKTS